jgi:RNA polymerase sigma-70 factor (ECF subfamily)
VATRDRRFMKRGGLFRPRLVFSAERADRTRAADADKAIRFRQAMLTHMDAAYNLARYLARDATIAEDIVQEAFLRAYRGFESWRGEAPKYWLLTIVRKCHLDHVAKNPKSRSATSIDELTGPPPPELVDHEDPESMLAEQGEAAMLRATIEQIPEPFREALVLRELEELSYKEIAAITEVPIGTVMSRLARAREMLHNLLVPDNRREARS